VQLDTTPHASALLDGCVMAVRVPCYGMHRLPRELVLDPKYHDDHVQIKPNRRWYVMIIVEDLVDARQGFSPCYSITQTVQYLVGFRRRELTSVHAQRTCDRRGNTRLRPVAIRASRSPHSLMLSSMCLSKETLKQHITHDSLRILEIVISLRSNSTGPVL